MSLKYVGKSIVRTDAISKVTGRAKFTADIKLPRMLYGKVLRSKIAHANIRSIKTEKAKNLPGVKAVITWKDVPRIPFAPAGHPYPEDTPQDVYILDNKVRFVGDAVAAVAAESPEIAQKALELIEVDYEQLPAVFSPEEAIKEGAPIIHESYPNNICGKSKYEYGNVSRGFEESDYIIEDEFKTPIVQHCPIETHLSIAYMDLEGRLIIHSPTQIQFFLRRILAKALDMPIGKVKVIKTTVGGGFGSKEDIVHEPVNAALAIKTGQPVLLEYSREENFIATRTRHSMILKVKSGVTKDGKLIARKMEVLSNTGAYSSHAHCVVENVSSQFAPLYPTPNIAFEAKTIYTNLPVAGAMRGYGIPQLNFAMESHMDNIARKLNIDSVELRKKNLCNVGDQDPVTNILIKSTGIRECIAKGEELTNWKQKQTKNLSKDDIKRKGIGVACFSYACCTFPFNEEMAGARVKVNEDGSAVLFIGSAEIGQGNDTVMAQIAAEELGIPFGNIKVITGDTDICPFDMGAYASRQLYVGGMAVKKAAAKCRNQILKEAAKIVKIPVDNLVTSEGWILDKGKKEKVISIKEVAMTAYFNKDEPMVISHEAHHAVKQNALSFGAVFVEVEVDTKIGKVEIEKIWSIHDSGKIINPKLAEGQVHGGAVMGMAYGLAEQLLYDSETGRILNNNLLDYKVPTFVDVPDIDAVFIETIEPSSAFGNKSLGEPPAISVAPAIRNAIMNAIDIGFNEIPITPERLLMKIKKSQT